MSASGMTRIILTLLVLLATTASAGIDSSKVMIKFVDWMTFEQRDSLVSQLDRVVAILEDPHVIDGFLSCSLATAAGYADYLDSLDQVTGIYLVEPYYLDDAGLPRLVGDGFCVGFVSGVSLGDVEVLGLAYNVIIDHEITAGTYLLRNTDSSGLHLLPLIEVYDGLPETRYAHPDWRVDLEPSTYRLYDHYHEHQDHIKKITGTFNQSTVWDFAGVNRPVTVAVLDDGVDSHEDLPTERLLPGYDFADHDSNATPPPHGAHGMACVGVLGASHTTDSTLGDSLSSGIFSLDPHVNVLPVKIFCTHFPCLRTDNDIAAAIKYAYQQGAEILSNSWTYTDPCEPGRAVVTEALEEAKLYGRGGLGCPLIFAAGNDGLSDGEV